MAWQKNDFQEAFTLYHRLLQEKGTIETRERSLIQTYQRNEVQEIIEQLIEPVANIKIFQSEEGSLHLVPNFDNTLLGFNNADLKEKMKLPNNKHLYLACFVILVTLSKFYNSDTQHLTTRAYITIETIEREIQAQMDDFIRLHPEAQEEFMEEYKLDFAGMIQVWTSFPVYNEKAKQIHLTDKNRIGFILKVCRFMQEQGLFVLRENREIELTDKLKRIINYYYFNEERKQRLMELLHSQGRNIDATSMQSPHGKYLTG